jgi:hypothetical protein
MLHINGSAFDSGISSIKAETTKIVDALYAITLVSPTLAAGVVVTPAATAWKLGAAGALVATNGIASAFQITGINIEGMTSVAAVCQFMIYEGTAASSVMAAGRARISTNATIGGAFYIPVISPQIAANKCVYAKVAADTTVQPAPRISISYKKKP